MGLVPRSGVPTFFYVESPNSPKVKTDAPAIGVSFTGTPRDVLIGDVIAIHGPRVPAAADSPRTFRPAFIYFVTTGRTTDPAQVAKLAKTPTQCAAYFLHPPHTM